MSSRPSLAPSAHRAVLIPSLALVLFGSLLLAAAAHVAVPFWPVPITLQTLAVLLIGAMAGPRLAASTVIAYIGEGLLGLPVFAHGAGIATLAGPTGGYLVGFLPAAILAGLAARQGWLNGIARTVAAFLLADALVFVFGLAWLSLAIGWPKALAVGLVPFLLGEMIKIGLATAVMELWRGRTARS